MKKVLFFGTLVVLLAVMMATAGLSPQQVAFAQTIIFEEDFETDGNGTRYTVSEECTDGNEDYFTRIDGTNIGGEVVYNSPNNSWWWAAQDTVSPVCTLSVETIEWTGINISGQSSLTFSGLFAEDDATDGLEDWDPSSLVFVEVNIDGAGYQRILQFAAVGVTDTEPAQDTDFDGVGDGTALTDTFASFGANIAGTGSSLDLRITVQDLTSGNEDVAFDLLRIEAPTAVELAAFSATPQGDSVLLQWETATELDNLGFNLYRAGSASAAHIKLNASLIPAANPGSAAGATYQFADQAAAPGVTYYYWLEDVDVYGTGTLHGPVDARLGVLRRLLPARLRLAPLAPVLRNR